MFCFISWAYCCRLKIKILETTSARSRRAGKFSQSRTFSRFKKMQAFLIKINKGITKGNRSTYVPTDTWIQRRLEEKKRTMCRTIFGVMYIMRINSARVTDVSDFEGFFFSNWQLFYYLSLKGTFLRRQTTFHNPLWRSLVHDWKKITCLR